MEINDKIVKLQGGGFADYSAALSPYVPLSLGQSVPRSSDDDDSSKSSSRSDKSSDKDTTRDEILRALMENGLPNETNQVISKMNNILSSSYFDSLSNSQKQAYYLQIISDVNTLKFNKEQYKDAIAKAQESGGLNDLAVTDYGRMIVQDQDGNLKQMTPETYTKNSDKYVPVTNSYLATLRAKSPELAYDSNIIGIIRNGIGPEKISDFISGITNGAQSNESTINKVVGSSQASEVVQGLQQLQNGLVKEGYSDKNNYKQVEAAVEYIYKMMPNRYRQYLRAKAAAEGSDTSVPDLIKQYAQIRLSRDVSQTESASGKGKSGSTSGGGVNSKGIVTQPMSGYLGGDQVDLKFNLGDSVTFTLGANKVYSNMERYKTLQDVMNNKDWGGSLDPHHVYFGSEHIDSIDTNRILYNGSNFHLTYLPVNDVGNPAFEVLTALGRVTKGQSAQEYVNHKYDYKNDLSLVQQYFDYDDASKKFVPKNQNNLFGRYWVMNGLASTKEGVLTDPEEAVLKPVKLDNSDIIKNAQAQFRAATAQKSPDGKTTSFYNPNDIYSGVVFIKDNGSYISAAVNSNKLTGEAYNNIAPVEDANRRFNQNNSASQLQPVNTSSTNLGI